MRKVQPTTKFAYDRETRAALIEFFTFVAAVLLAYFIFGGFNGW